MSQSTTTITRNARWTDGLTPAHWRTLAGGFLGWIFDGYEAMAPLLIMTPMLHSVLSNSQAKSVGLYAGLLLGITLIGWGIGGLAGGVVADYMGRKKVMLWSVLLYAAFSGGTAFAHGFVSLVSLRFLTGLAMGSEWSTGVALVSETWPDGARAKGVSFLQSGYGWGTFIAGIAWYMLSRAMPDSPDAWRWMFVLGALPALFVLYLRRGVDESEKWAAAVKGAQWVEEEFGEHGTPSRRPFPLKQLLASPTSRKLLLSSLLLSMVTSTGLWAVSSWLPTHVVTLAQGEGLPDAQLWGAKVSLIYTAGAIVAYLAAGFVVDVIGRRAFVCATFAGSLAMTIVTYHFVVTPQTMMWVAPISGFFTLGCSYVWMAIYPTELFRSSVRATAISFVFNGARLVIWVFPILAGSMIRSLGGIPHAALLFGSIYVIGIIVPWFMPETLGLPLPD
ncbi:MFS transporter [Paraburkholderia caribensis]|uniref:MFS transporter n=1 Tax=Paraburkholderia caribensis TaxID=75105 RepID=UPI00071FB9A8|nr:MFS transporter [Paraburkholderia caribensis]ALP68519.1 MFS transporter [Paraburkholderia caribensis]AUT57874.1 MFS transporter [Paraburkholderia caribensis]